MVPQNGFFDLIIVNLPFLESQAKCDMFLSNYRQYPSDVILIFLFLFLLLLRKKISPGGLLVLTGFEQVNDWLRCVGVDKKAALPSTIIDII